MNDPIYSFYERTLSHDWNMTPIDRSLDPIKVMQYLNLIPDPTDRAFIKDVLDNTVYINYEQIYLRLKINSDFYYNISKLLYISDNKIINI